MKGLVFVMVMVPLAAASAATITVNTRADNTTAGDAQCTLREAIANVNAAADTSGGDCNAGTGAGDAIAFTLSLPATISLMHGELAVGQSVIIAGPVPGSPTSLRISGRRTSRIFEITAGTTSISDLTIERGRPDHDIGGGVLVNSGATLQLTNCTLRRNTAFGGGGAIYNAGTATLTRCTLSRNTTPNLVAISNPGGGIFNSGTLALTDCTLSANKARMGGGLYNSVPVFPSPIASATLTGCTLSANSAARDGGGIVNGGILTMTNCTLAGNKTTRSGGTGGGGIFNAGTATLTNCTLSGNTARRGGAGGGIYNFAAFTTTLTNTIIAKSGAAGNCAGSIISNGHNLSSDNTCSASNSTDIGNTIPQLAPLASYGGPTKTMALCTGPMAPKAACRGSSPAIDAGDDTVTGPPDNLTTDQRGLPRLGGSHVDIGAYEVQ